MKKNTLLLTLLALLSSPVVFASVDVAPAVPDLMLPTEEEPVVEEKKAPVSVMAGEEISVVGPEFVPPTPEKAPAKRKKVSKKKVPPVTKTADKVNTEKVKVEDLLPPQPEQAAPSTATVADPVPPATGTGENFEPARETKAELTDTAKKKEPKVVFNPSSDRDPMLSVDDALLLKHREEQRLRAIEAERQRKIEEERRRLAEIERQRQLELERLRDPSKEIRGKIRINGIIGQEVFIGNRVYGVGSTVLGARIVQVLPESVVFTYKGQRFTKKVQLK